MLDADTGIALSYLRRLIRGGLYSKVRFSLHQDPRRTSALMLSIGFLPLPRSIIIPADTISTRLEPRYRTVTFNKMLLVR